MSSLLKNKLRLIFDPSIAFGERSRYQYVLEYVLAERLGLSKLEVRINRQRYRISWNGDHVDLPNHFLGLASTVWGNHESAKIVRFPQVGSRSADAEVESKEDYFGAIFFVLTRYDEWVSPIRDRFGRFPSGESFLYRAGLLERPVVDEWICDLAETLPDAWQPFIKLRRNFVQYVSCDVDWAFGSAQMSLARAILQSARSLRRDRLAPISPLRSYARALRYGYQEDNTRRALSWIMDINEREGNRVAFYFIPQATSQRYDSDLDYAAPPVIALLQEISNRGHEIGIHPGFATATSAPKFRESVQAFHRHLERAGIRQQQIGGRQHYLRWDARQTATHYETNGLAYDTTLGFADAPGFRCGTSHEHPLFDLESDCRLNLIERPLVIMEAALLSKHTAITTAYEHLEMLKQRCRTYGGCFSLLWHNTSLDDEAHRALYCFGVASGN